jgi:DUF971 family protein
MNEPPWPTDLKLRDGGHTLAVIFDDGTSYDLAAEYLRVESPSAEVKGHGPGQEITVAGKRQVRILTLAPVGNYAVRIGFDDGHSSGLYTWDYLMTLGREHAARWADYLARLQSKGLKREPR